MQTGEHELVSRYQAIFQDRMRDLPICNPVLKVQAVGFRTLDQHRLGVLITPWFMNLMLLPGDDTWADEPAGTREDYSLPAENCEFVINHDELLGTCLSAVLFRTLSDFPDQATAVAVAEEVLDQLFTPADGTAQEGAVHSFSRRSLLTGMGAS
jgi:[NiFe] hydrogenase assembly HybE family chaperone